MARSPQPPRRRSNPPAHYGRDRERARLRELLDEAVEGHGSLVLVSGEAGIGKTALIHDLVTEAGERGCLVLSGGCYDLTTTPPYGPWIEAIRDYRLGGEQPAVPSWFSDPEELSKIGSQTALFDEVHSFLASITARQPLLIVLEDLHWSDLATLEALRYLARGTVELRLLLAVTYRDDEIHQHHSLYQTLPLLVREARTTRVELRRLDTAAVQQWVAARYRLLADDEQRLVQYLDLYGEGNPLYIGEVLRTLEAEQVITQTAAGWRVAELSAVHIPPLLRQVIGGRLQRLEATTRDTLALAAVIGDEVSLDIWEAVGGLEAATLDQVIAHALDGHVLVESPGRQGLRFSHALVREVLYESITPTRRRLNHRLVAETLEQLPRPDPDAVAYHFQQAGDARAVEWLIRAGLRAERRYALIMAAEHFEVAQALLAGDATQDQMRGWLLLRSGWLLRYANPEQGLAYVKASGRLAMEVGDQVLAAYSLFARGLARLRGRLQGQRLAELEAGVAAIDALSPADRARTETPLAELVLDAFPTDPASLSAGGIPMPGRSPGGNPFKQWLVEALAMRGDNRAAITLGEQHIAQIRAATSDEQLVQATCIHAYVGLGIAYTALGQPDEAERWLRLASAAVTALGEHAALASVLLEEMYLLLTYRTEQVAKRRELARQSTQAARYALEAQATERTDTAGFHLPVGWIEGRWAGAREVMSASRKWDWAQELLARLAHAQGQPGEAWELVHQFMPHGPETEPGEVRFYYAIRIQRLAVMLALDAGDLSTARQWLELHDRWLAWSGAVPGQADGQLLWARFHQATGDPETAHRYAQQALDHASEPRQPLGLIAAHRLLGELARQNKRFVEAEEHLRESHDLAEHCAAPFEQALTLLAIAELRAVTGKPDEAWQQLDQVRAICTPLGAMPTLQRATAIAAKLSVRRGQPVHPAGLTPRELEVLGLVAQGLTDAEVAERLFISPRTVGVHLSSVYNKLGVNSRVEATRFAVEHGLVGPAPA